jgi:hypothetical protein
LLVWLASSPLAGAALALSVVVEISQQLAAVTRFCNPASAALLAHLRFVQVVASVVSEVLTAAVWTGERKPHVPASSALAARNASARLLFERLRRHNPALP